jgi:hypothetical protein
MPQTQDCTSGTVQPGTALAPQQSLWGGGGVRAAAHSLTASATQTWSNAPLQHWLSMPQTQLLTEGSVQPGAELAVQQSLSAPGMTHCDPQASASPTQISSNDVEQQNESCAQTHCSTSGSLQPGWPLTSQHWLAASLWKGAMSTL